MYWVTNRYEGVPSHSWPGGTTFDREETQIRRSGLRPDRNSIPIPVTDASEYRCQQGSALEVQQVRIVPLMGHHGQTAHPRCRRSKNKSIRFRIRENLSEVKLRNTPAPRGQIIKRVDPDSIHDRHRPVCAPKLTNNPSCPCQKRWLLE
jgi:hypothetical protein